jgi:hypothetical protein
MFYKTEWLPDARGVPYLSRRSFLRRYARYWADSRHRFCTAPADITELTKKAKWQRLIASSGSGFGVFSTGKSANVVAEASP